MKFSALSEHVIANAGSVDSLSALTMADLATTLELSALTCSGPQVQLRLRELAEALKSAPTRPHAEQLLGEAARIFDVDPPQLFLDALQRALCVTFIEGVRAFDPLYRFEEGPESSAIHLSAALLPQKLVGVCEVALACDAAIAAATIESVLLSFLGGHDVGAVLSVVRKAADANHRPAIACGGTVLRGGRLRSLPIVTEILNYADARDALEARMNRAIEAVDDPTYRRLLSEVLRRPGLLFFDHVTGDVAGISELLAPHRTIRSFLQDGLSKNSELQGLVSSLISESATIIDHLIAIDTEKRESRAELRPDSLMGAMLRSVEQEVTSLTGATLSPREREVIREMLQERIENDPTYGTGISAAFSFDYPAKGGEPASRMTCKIFQEFRRTQALDKKRSLQCVLEVRPPELEGDLRYDYDHARSLSDELEGLLDDAECLDRFSGTGRLEQVGMRVLHLIGKTFSCYEEITRHGAHRISPRFEKMEQSPPIEQILRLWKGCTWLDRSISPQARGRVVAAIESWIVDYGAAKGFYAPVTISDLVGAVSLFGVMALRAEADDSCPTVSHTNHLFRRHASHIELMPSGFHSLLWILPESSRASVENLLSKELIIVDMPTPGSITFLKSTTAASAEGILRALKHAIGTTSPIRLSSIMTT